MPAYFIAEIKVHDPEPYREYVSKVPAMIAKYGGRYVVRGGNPETVMGDWDAGRIIVIEFDSAERIHEWLDSPEYREIAPLRERSTVSRAIIVEGLQDPDSGDPATEPQVRFDLSAVALAPRRVALYRISWALYLVGIAIIALSYLGVVSPGVGWLGWLVGMSGWVLSFVGRRRW